MADKEKNLTTAAKGKQDASTNIADMILSAGGVKGTPGGIESAETWSQKYLAEHGPQGARGSDQLSPSPTPDNGKRTLGGGLKQVFQPFISKGAIPKEPARSFTGEMSELYKADMARSGSEAGSVTTRRPSFGQSQYGERLAQAQKSGELPEFNRQRAENYSAWETERDSILGERMQARQSLLKAYTASSPQTRAMIPPELRMQLDTEVLQNRPPPQAPQIGTRVPASSGRMAAQTNADQRRLSVWAAKPAQPPAIDRPSPIKGGFFKAPEYINLQSDKKQDMKTWTTATNQVQEQRRKLLTRAINQPDEEE